MAAVIRSSNPSKAKPSAPRPLPGATLTKKERELETKVKTVIVGVSEAVATLGNEPSLGLYRLQEHIRKSVPATVKWKDAFRQIGADVNGACYDADYAESAIRQIKAAEHFEQIQEHLNKAVALKDQLNKRDGSGRVDSIVETMSFM